MIIYDKNGKSIADVAKFQYKGIFMGESCVMVDIDIPMPINLEIGSYLTYRKERYELNYTPAKIKESSKNKDGGAFKYKGVKFTSTADELTRCDFLDVVLADNKIHFTNLPTFGFYATSVKDLADRIQANLDRIYTNDKKWTVKVDPTATGGSQYVNVTKINCWDALAMANSLFQHNFVIKGRTITIGTSGLSVGKIFGYGKGKGLFTIEQQTNNNTQIITRLRAYGNSRNLPLKYYNNLKSPSGGFLIPESQYVTRVMLPQFAENGGDAYVDSENISKYGVREGTVYFDGTDKNLPDIYPSIEGVTAEEIKSAGIPISSTGLIDEIINAEQITDNGEAPKEGEGKPLKSTFSIDIKDVGFDINKHLSTEAATIHLKTGMCADRKFEITKCEKTDTGYKLTVKREEDSDIGLWFPYNGFNLKAGDKFVLLNIEMPDVYIKAAEQRLLSAAKDYISQNDKSKYTYLPKIDNKFMADNPQFHDTIKEGDIFHFDDTDLGINASVIIQSLTIKEGGSVPEYEITLFNDKATSSTIDKIQSSITNLANHIGITAEQARSIASSVINAWYPQWFDQKLHKSADVQFNSVMFAKLLESIGAVDSMVAGKGTILTEDGRIQTDRIEVRHSMKVLELIINRLQGMENDFVFAPTRKVLKVEKIDETTYKLLLDPKMDGDLIPFREGNILYSIVNDMLTGGSNYYTSYMRVLATNQNDYSITVSLYPDSEVPGGKNYIPVAGYNISRRGNANLVANKEDAQSWYLSSSEGRLLFLQNVVKPALEDYNYALSVGKFPRIQAIKDIGLPEDAVGVMAETIVAQHVYQYDYNGDVVPNVVDRGQWSLAVAQSSKPYRNITVETMRPNGTKYTLLEQHAVWRFGCKWGCLVDKTIEEPRWNAQGWILLEGNGSYSLDFDSSEGWQFFRGKVDTIISAVVTYANEDITDRLMSAPSTEVEWLRDSGNVPSDNTWKPTFVNNQRNKLKLTNDDMPSEWGLSIRKVKFVCKVYIPDGIEPIAMNEFGFQI